MRLRRRIVILIAYVLLLALALPACSVKKVGEEAAGFQTDDGMQKEPDMVSADMQRLLEEIDWDAADEIEWQDNTLDAWMASTLQLLSFKGLAGIKPLANWADDFCMTPNGVSVFMSRAYQDEDGQIPYLMERIRCTRDGKVEDEIFAKGQNLAKPRVLAYGIASGTEELWGNIHSNMEEIYGKSEEQSREGDTIPPRIFWQLNDDGTIKKDGKTIAISFMGQGSETESIDQFMLDKDGRVYILVSTYNYQEIDGRKILLASPGRCLYVASPEGEKLCCQYLASETKDTAGPSFVMLPGGKVGISFFYGEGSGRRLTLFHYDEEKADLTAIAALDNSYLTNYALTLADTGKLISADSAGIWESDPQGGERTQLYTWKEHGMRPHVIYGLHAAARDAIDVLFADADGLHYLSLKPVTQKQEITELVMATSSTYADKYKEAVMRFNQKYPSYHLTLKSDYGSARLNSEIIAGNGPVLIDTNLTGFAQLKDYWEPLGGVLEKMGLSEELEPKATEAGKIGQTTYGVITDFCFETLITIDPETENWNYDSFLEYLKAHSDRPYIYMDYDENCASLFIHRFCQNGPNDGVLFNAEKKENYIDTDRFREILQLVTDKCQNKGRLDDKDDRTRLLDGETSFLLAYFLKPSDLALFRVLYGDTAYIVGEPMQNGAAHILQFADPVVIRNAATTEEKKGALLFIRELLSYKSQKSASNELNFHFSVRKDVLKECITSLDAETYLDSNIYLGARKTIKLGNRADPEKDWQRLTELLEHAVPVTYLPQEVSSILWEELEPYFEGAVSQADMIRKLHDRIDLYVKEQ